MATAAEPISAKPTAPTFGATTDYLLGIQGTSPATRKFPAAVVRAGLVASASITTIVKLTQAQFDALSTKDANTFYAIVG